ncbi:ABC transporter substrate-binding protein [Mariniluteicoccus endophyticus]
MSTDFPSPPARTVALTSNATETLLELGLGDRMVGTAYMRGREIAPKYSEAYAKIPVLSTEQPTMEQLIAVQPDFVYSGYPDGFSPKTGHTREQLRDSGVKSHLTPEGCAKGAVKVDDIYSEIETMGKVFRVEDRARVSVTSLRERVEAVRTRVGSQRPVKVFLYASGTDKAATTGRNSMATALIRAAGGENVFADVNERWMSVSWEQVAERNPDIILVREEGTTPQYQSPSVASKIEALKGVPVISQTTAIKDNRFATLTLSQLQPGPYSIDGIEHMAKQFHPAS